MAKRSSRHVWLFDLDDTLHDASSACLGAINDAMTAYIAEQLRLPLPEADALRVHYWRRYGATLLGLERHHGVRADRFLDAVHRLPGLEARLRSSSHDRAVLRRLPGRKIVLTNAPLAYATRVLNALRLGRHFESIVAIEQMRMFGQLRPKPDMRMLRRLLARLGVPGSSCTLVEDTLAHQRAARALRLRTVWIQRYSRSTARQVRVRGHPCRKPPYVCARIKSFHALYKL
jgi:putative hydrolase of the HAD superfamily